MGEIHFATVPMAIYGAVLLMSAIAYFLLQRIILKTQGPNSLLAKAVGKDIKGKISSIITLFAIASSWVHPAISGGIYVLLALMWLIPDLRIERVIDNEKN